MSECDTKDINKTAAIFEELNDLLLGKLLNQGTVMTNKNFNKCYTIDEVVTELFENHEIEKNLFENMDVTGFSEFYDSHNFKYDVDYFKKNAYYHSKINNPNQRELYYLCENEKIIDHQNCVFIQPITVALRSFYPNTQYFELQRFSGAADKYKYKNYYLTPNGIEDQRVFSIRKEFRDNIVGMKKSLVNEIMTFPNKYETPDNVEKLKKLLKTNNLTKEKFVQCKKSYIRYTRTSNRLTAVQKSLRNFSLINPNICTVYYRIYYNQKTFYFIPDSQLLMTLLKNTENANPRDVSRLIKLLKVMKAQALTTKLCINNRRILTIKGLSQLFNEANKVYYTKFSKNDLLFYSYMFEENKCFKFKENKFYLIRNVYTAPLQYNAMPILGYEQRITSMISFRMNVRYGFLVHQAVVRKYYPDIQNVCDLINSVKISVNEQNYRLMIVADLYHIDNFHTIKAVTTVKSMTENDASLIKAFKIVFQHESGVGLPDSCYDYYKKNFAELIHKHSKSLKELKVKFDQTNNNYTVFRTVVELYEHSLYSLLRHNARSTVVSSILQSKEYQQTCKPYMNCKMIGLIYPRIRVLLTTAYVTKLMDSRQCIVEKLNTKVQQIQESSSHIKMLKEELQPRYIKRNEDRIQRVKKTIEEIKPQTYEVKRNSTNIIDCVFMLSLATICQVLRDVIKFKYAFNVELIYRTALHIYLQSKVRSAKKELLNFLYNNLRIPKENIFDKEITIAAIVEKIMDYQTEETLDRMKRNKSERVMLDGLSKWKRWTFSVSDMGFKRRKDG
jgi:hypothetical protein